MLDAYIYDGLRTPFGRYAGKLAAVRADTLVAGVIKSLIGKYNFDPTEIEDVIIGCTNQSGEDSVNIARYAALLSGLPVTVPGQTINRLCASGLSAVVDAARAVTCREGELFLAGGVENMSRAPFVVTKSEYAYSRDFTMVDSTIGVRFPHPDIIAHFGNDTMPETAENVARDFSIRREDSDIFAAGSQAKYAKALAQGFYAEEIIPVVVPQGGKKPPMIVEADEHPRSESNVESLSMLKPLVAGGITVTAGNASGINDGAAMLIVGNHSAGLKAGMQPMARILASAAVGIEPRIMGIGPVAAVHKALGRAGLSLRDVDVIEVNEAFATQVLGCLKLLEIAFDDSRVNPNGGAIAIGHPLGASGARLILTAARQLIKTNGRYAVISLCIGYGQGSAVVIENMKRT